MKTHTHHIDVRATLQLSEKILNAVDGEMTQQVEDALIMAYARIAQGIKTFPDSTRELRFWRFLELAPQALVDCLVEIEAVSDADMKMWEIQRRALHKATSGVQ